MTVLKCDISARFFILSLPLQHNNNEVVEFRQE